MSGTSLFARYAYPPNELGYCGPDGASVLLDASPQTEAAIAEHARRFEGAWSYLEIIAAAAGIGDPLDERVVEAYWLGNGLLDHVDPDQMVARLRSAFGDQPHAAWTPGLAHHSYQVFAVYPWVELLRRGTGGAAALHVLEKCRIRSGTVVRIEGATVRVRSRPLIFLDGRLGLGDEHEESVDWSVAGRSLVARPEPGHQVAMHWNWVCDVLTGVQASELERRSADQLTRTNSALAEAAG